MKIRELFESQSNAEIKQIIQNYIHYNKDKTKPLYPGDTHYTKYKFGQYKIINGKVELKNPFQISGLLLTPEGKLPLSYGNCGQCTVFAQKLSSFEGFPTSVTTSGSKDNMNYAMIFQRDLENIKSWEGITSIFKGGIDFHLWTNVPAFKNIHKYIKEIDGFVVLPKQYVGPLLGFTEILKFKGFARTNLFEDTHKAVTIINDLIKQKADILTIQEKLLEAGLKEYAKL